MVIRSVGWFHGYFGIDDGLLLGKLFMDCMKVYKMSKLQQPHPTLGSLKSWHGESVQACLFSRFESQGLSPKP